ncbi:hypothetical protein L6R50_14830 [Myxococcota bacterium]|nr:hypothetical protein [Myxococcota bacterium]
MANAWDVPLAYWVVQPPQAREPYRFDRTPQAKWLRATTERQAVVDAARITAAAVGAPTTDEGRLRAAAVAQEWAREIEMPAIFRYDNHTALNVLPGGAASVALTGSTEKRAAALIAAIYARAAKQLDAVGAPKWAVILWDGVEAMGGRVERAEEPTIKRAVKDTVQDVRDVAPKVGFGLGMGVVLVAAVLLLGRR